MIPTSSPSLPPAMPASLVARERDSQQLQDHSSTTPSLGAERMGELIKNRLLVVFTVLPDFRGNLKKVISELVEFAPHIMQYSQPG